MSTSSTKIQSFLNKNREVNLKRSSKRNNAIKYTVGVDFR